MKAKWVLIVSFIVAVSAYKAAAFCGFYVAKADTKLFNKASKVILVRDNDKTVLTMANDYQGNPREFAIVIPVPTFIEKAQIHVASASLIDHIDAYSAPRLVEYHDEDPCNPQIRMLGGAMEDKVGNAAGYSKARASSLGVKIEAQYTVGEYDIVILSAFQSSGLETWLKESGYSIPEGASDVLRSYIKQNMRFFVAKVNLKEQSKLGFSFLRPLQIAFNSPKFMLPIRLGTVNAEGTQDLFVFTLTKNGRVETTNYRTVKLTEGVEIPPYVKDNFADFYRDMFTKQVQKEDGRAVFLEYAWDMGWCDPCAAEPLSNSELRELGVFWIQDQPAQLPQGGVSFVPQPTPQQVFLTRLHIRYDSAHFPEDPTFQETSDKSNFQARYVLRHPWTGTSTCPQADEYQKSLRKRMETEVSELSKLTGWKVEDIAVKAELPAAGKPDGDDKWWQNVWK
jgi:hypothetical protein